MNGNFLARAKLEGTILELHSLVQESKCTLTVWDGEPGYATDAIIANAIESIAQKDTPYVSSVRKEKKERNP